MMILTLALIVGLISTGVMLIRQRNDDNQLTSPRAALRTVGIQIICGDCSGEADRPSRTYLDKLGHCSQCGGHSYVLATNMYAHLLRSYWIAEHDKLAGPGRVLAFNSTRQEKIAV